MTQINLIRDLAKSGYKISEIHELTKADPKTISKYLEKDDFSPTPPIKQARSSIVAPFYDRIMEYLEEDKKHWGKQRHTAKRIFERLKNARQRNQVFFDKLFDAKVEDLVHPELAGQ